jgi:hypothetical protein
LWSTTAVVDLQTMKKKSAAVDESKSIERRFRRV